MLVAIVLDFLTGPRQLGFMPRSRLRGIRLQADDIDRAWGEGPEIQGPVAALMMTATGRTALIDLLDGPGLPVLRERLLG